MRSFFLFVRPETRCNFVAMKMYATLLLAWMVSPLWCQFSGLSFSPTPKVPDTVWIITGRRELGPAYRKFKLDLALDARQTLISSQAARIGGVRFGLEYKRVHRVGVGLYGVGDGIKLSSINELDSTISWAKLHFSYQSLYYERVLYFSRKLEWSATTHYGRGKINGSYVRIGDAEVQTLPEQRVRILEFSTLGYYNVNYWCSVGLGVGYRYMFGAPDDIRKVYEAPVALFRVRIKVGKLIKSIWDKDTKNLY